MAVEMIVVERTGWDCIGLKKRCKKEAYGKGYAYGDKVSGGSDVCRTMHVCGYDMATHRQLGPPY